MESIKIEQKSTSFSTDQLNASLAAVKKRSDYMINYFLAAFFAGGLFLAMFYDTWMVGIAVGGGSLLAYYITKYFLPESDLYQYVLSAVLAIFMAQYIYQMHGMFEMHFIAFVGCTLLITYQNWRLQIPLLAIVLIHHASFGYLQYAGMKDIYFTQLAYMDIQTFIIHGFLAGVIVFISGLWAYTLRKSTIKDTERTIALGKLQMEEEHNKNLMEANTKLEVANLRNEETNKSLLKEIDERIRQTHTLKKLNANLDEFAYVVSHDLKSPLRAINNLSAWIEEDLGPDATEEVKKNIALLHKRVFRMESLINGILNYSRIRKTTSFENVDTAELLSDVVDSVSIPPGMKIHIQENMPEILAEKVKIQQVFANLISNAIKYHHTKSGEIHVNFQEAEDGLNFFVKDDGPGIDPQFHDRIFRIFQTLSSRDTVESTGIGLSIVKKIVEEAGGTVTVDSEVGRGATFIVFWPKDPIGWQVPEEEVVG